MMNKEEILQSKSGRDLDIIVALRVMDYVWIKHLIQFSAELAVKWLGTQADLEQSGGVYVVVPDSQFISLKERENFDEAVLGFSTDIEAAELVVKHMEELGYEYKLESKVTEEEETKYYACFEKQEKVNSEELGTFATVPEAIVKAALVALL